MQRQGVVVGGREFNGAIAAGGAAVCGVVADADGDADDALVIGHFLGERAVVGDGLVGVDVVETVLDEVGPLHARQEQALLAIKLLFHGVEERVVSLGG